LKTLDPQFDTWKFWLSSVVLFAGVLTVGLIPGCAKDEKPQQQQNHSSWSAQADH
jgi:hypothetical protein